MSQYPYPLKLLLGVVEGCFFLHFVYNWYKMEGIIAYNKVENLKQRISDLEKENAELRKKLETSTAERLGFRSVSFGSPCMEDPLPEPETPRPIWKPYPNANWREDGIY